MTTQIIDENGHGTTANQSAGMRLYGEQNLLVVQDETGAIVKTWLTKWLQSQLHAQGGEVGDLMALTFGGKKVTKAGRHFNAYTLVVEKV
ncbi:MAG: hypothetical protein PHN45_06420 [Methylococcales bacterium]|nr:hypothetical protein [Methylococcales bacterium]MDD5754369.1 hypothetical protein [Methylococcales bacterium]